MPFIVDPIIEQPHKQETDLVSLYMDTEQLEFRGNRVDRVVRRIYPKEQIIFRAAQITDVIRYWSGYGYRRMALGYRASRY